MTEYQSIPLAERMRPESLEEFTGQRHLVGEGAVLRKAIESGAIPSMIFWGPPGVGKTTLAFIISRQLKRPFYALSAINSGVKDVREVIEKAKKETFFGTNHPILFIDEIHRFSKSQQDSLLAAVERGIVTLIGATTENPSFEVISALLSRCQVYVMKALEEADLKQLLNEAIRRDEQLKEKTIKIAEWEALLRLSGGDGRKLLNTFDLVINAIPEKEVIVTNELVLEHVQQQMAMYDKAGEQHYDIISAYIKSIRGSDPNGALYWLARMIEGGEDPLFIARRLLILAAEDIGMANPTALVMANNCFQSLNVIGMPEGRIILSHTTVYLATSPKSNAVYTAIDKALSKVRESGDLPVPLHLRNAPTRLMKQLDYGKDYRYAHDYPGHFIEQEFLPDSLSGTRLFEPGDSAREKELHNWLSKRWKDRYGY